MDLKFSSSKKKNISIFCCGFKLFKPRIPWGEPIFEHNSFRTKMQSYTPKFMQLNPAGLEKKIFQYLHFKNLPTNQVSPGTERTTLDKLGKRLLDKITYKISSIWERWFWKKNNMFVFLWLKTRTTKQIRQGNWGIVTPVLSIWAKWFWGKRFLNIFMYYMLWMQNLIRQCHFQSWDRNLNNPSKGP